MEPGGTLNLFDGTHGPLGPGRKHGPLGYDHAGRVEVDYLYQAEQYMIEMPEINPEVVRAELHRGGAVVARWSRAGDGTFAKEAGR